MTRHAPENQPPPMPDHDTWACDASSRWWVEHLSRAAGTPVRAADDAWLHEVGTCAGAAALRASADRANRVGPELLTHSRYGERIDDVRFDASWHEVLGAVQASGVCGLPWRAPANGYLLRGAALEQWARLDMGVMCPISMTTAAIALLRRHSDNAVLAELLGEPRAGHATAGMAMTEPQGGSDLAGSTVRATPQPDGTFALTGHKWFVSHAVADVLFVLAREDGLDEATATGSRGLSCFEVYGWLGAAGHTGKLAAGAALAAGAVGLPAGAHRRAAALAAGASTPDRRRNGIELLRLKDKLGTRSLASCEVQLDGAIATRVGAPGDGVRTIIEMVVHTRMDCALGSTGIMTRALSEAVWHASHRRAFGALLVDQPLMRCVLTDLMLEREAALALSHDVTRAFDRMAAGNPDDPDAAAIARIVPAIAKYYVTRRAVAVTVEAVEALGGNGYTEEFPLARLYRDAQVNSTWEGSGNVIVLDVYRALTNPATLGALRAHVARLITGDPTGAGERIAAMIADPPPDVSDGRGYVGRLACGLAAALLVSRAAATGLAEDRAVADAWIITRVDQPGPRVFGDAGSLLGDARELVVSRGCVPLG